MKANIRQKNIPGIYIMLFLNAAINHDANNKQGKENTPERQVK